MSATQPLLSKDPDSTYGALTPPPRMADMRREHKATIDTSQGTVYFFTTPLASFLACLFLPCALLGAPTTIPPRHEAVGTVFGEYVGVWRRPGMYFINPCGLRLHFVSVNNRAVELAAIKVADGQGNSLQVSGIVTYRVVDSARAALDMEHLDTYVRIQAHAVLKRTCSRCPYITYDGSPSLIKEQSALGLEMAAALRDKVAVAGVEVSSFELADLSYSSEIAPLMLVRQQAQAVVDARKTVVAGAVGIVADALTGLADKNVQLGGETQERLVANLMTVICSEKSPLPTIQM